MELVAFVGDDKENWGQISALMKRSDADKIYLIVKKGVDGFPRDDRTEIVEVNSSSGILELKKEIVEKMRTKLSGDFEVSLSLASGNGKEHMALISALLTVPVGIRIVVFTKDGIEHIN